MSNKDELIAKQLEIIRAMTEKNIKNVGNDLFGSPATAPVNKETKAEQPAAEKAEQNEAKQEAAVE